jgi:predicted Fe-Mo cluster-binding NifX family protein
MKIAISTSDVNLDAPYDPRFGRAAHFCIVDLETEEFDAYPNSAINASGGAGVQAAQFIAEHGAEAVISGHFGPNAFTTLDAAKIQMFQAPAGDTLTARELLGLYREGQLEMVTGATNAGHISSPQGRGRGIR